MFLFASLRSYRLNATSDPCNVGVARRKGNVGVTRRKSGGKAEKWWQGEKAIGCRNNFIGYKNTKKIPEIAIGCRNSFINFMTFVTTNKYSLKCALSRNRARITANQKRHYITDLCYDTNCLFLQVWFFTPNNNSVPQNPNISGILNRLET